MCLYSWILSPRRLVEDKSGYLKFLNEKLCMIILSCPIFLDLGGKACCFYGLPLILIKMLKLLLSQIGICFQLLRWLKSFQVCFGDENDQNPHPKKKKKRKKQLSNAWILLINRNYVLPTLLLDIYIYVASECRI